MRPRRKRPFQELLGRQLDLFAEDQAELLEEAERARRSYSRAGRGEGEERYAEYLEIVEEATDALTRLREGYAMGLDDDAEQEYRLAFNDAARKRFPTFGLELDDYLGYDE